MREYQLFRKRKPIGKINENNEIKKFRKFKTIAMVGYSEKKERIQKI